MVYSSPKFAQISQMLHDIGCWTMFSAEVLTASQSLSQEQEW